MKFRLFGSSRRLRTAALFALLPVIAARPAAASFSSCVAGLQEAAVRAGVSRSVASRALDIAQPDEKVLRLSEVQPEFKAPIWDYLGFLVDEQRVADGRAMMRQYEQILRAAERRFGVDRHVIAAVWGVETDYGREAGDNYLPRALATLVCEGDRRTNFWRSELIAALKLVDDGDLRLDELYGSWAGAFGQTQFIPYTYQRLAVDFDGDGRRDLVRSVADALGSTANYLKRSGWQPGDPWTIEVTVPRGYDGPTGRGNKSSLSSWARRNVLRADGARLSAGAPVEYKQAGLLLPAGPQGPGFLVFRNFDAIFLQSGDLSARVFEGRPGSGFGLALNATPKASPDSDVSPAGPLDRVAYGGYLALMRAVGLKMLKNKLSEYVRLAASGETVLVTDRDRVVAELVPPRAGRSPMLADARLAEAVRRGWLTPPALSPAGAPARAPVAPLHDLLQELAQDRAER